MEVSINELLEQVEFVPFSLSDLFKGISIDPSTMVIMKFLPIIGFIALLIAAIWRQSKKFPLKAFSNLNNVMEPKLEVLSDSNVDVIADSIELLSSETEGSVNK